MTVPVLTLMVPIVASPPRSAGCAGPELDGQPGKGAIVRRIPDAALLRHSGVTAGIFSSLTWTFVTLCSRAGGSIRLALR